MPQPAGTLAQFEDARAAPHRVASGVMECPVSLWQIPHIGQRADLNILDRRKVGGHGAVTDRWLQQGSAVVGAGVVGELDDILLELTDPVNQLAARPRALLPGQFDPRWI